MPIAKLLRVSAAADATPRAAGSARAFSLPSALLAAAAVLLCCSSASAQKKLLRNDDIALSGAGIFGSSISGKTPFGVSLTEKPSTAAELLFSFRYTHSSLFGLEANYGYTRLDEDFSPLASSTLPSGAQTNIEEFSLGYMLHAHPFFGAKPFLGAGIGVIDFKPSFTGGLALPPQARMLYYGTAGFDAPFTKHLGMRAQVREVIFKAPDFGQNYLTIDKRTQTFEPTIGFYVHF